MNPLPAVVEHLLDDGIYVELIRHFIDTEATKGKHSAEHIRQARQLCADHLLDGPAANEVPKAHLSVA